MGQGGCPFVPFRTFCREVVFGEGVPELAGEFVAQQAGVGEVRDRGFLHHCAVFEYSHAIGHAQRQLDVVRDQQHAAARVREGAEIIEQSQIPVYVGVKGMLEAAF